MNLLEAAYSASSGSLPWSPKAMLRYSPLTPRDENRVLDQAFRSRYRHEGNCHEKHQRLGALLGCLEFQESDTMILSLGKVDRAPYNAEFCCPTWRQMALRQLSYAEYNCESL